MQVLVSDGPVLELVDKFLRQDVMQDGKRRTPTGGTPQGAVISPLLANVYLHPLDVLMEESGYRMVRDADDFVILCRSREEAMAAGTGMPVGRGKWPWPASGQDACWRLPTSGRGLSLYRLACSATIPMR